MWFPLGTNKQRNKCLCTPSTLFKPDLSEQINTCDVFKQSAAPLTWFFQRLITIKTKTKENHLLSFLLVLYVGRSLGLLGNVSRTHKTPVFGYLETVWKFWVCQFYPVWLYGHTDIDLRRPAKRFGLPIFFAKKSTRYFLWTRDNFSRNKLPEVFFYAQKSFLRTSVIFCSLKVRNIAFLLFNSMVLFNLIGNNEIWRFRSFMSLNSAVEHVNVAISSLFNHHCFIDE